MAVEERLRGIKPLQGELDTLPSVQELRPVDSFEEAYVAEIDIKSSNVVVKLLDTHYPRNPEVSRSHLRRLLRPENLPEPLRQELEEAQGPKPTASIHVLIPPPLPETSELQALLAPYTPRISPPSHSGSDTTTTTTEQPSPEKLPTVRIQKTLISTKPPTTPAEALEWSCTKWSTIYNPAARVAAHAPPQVQLVRAKASIYPRAGYFLALAKEVANETLQSGRGRGVGVVIVDPELTVGKPDDTNDLLNAVVAVSGDTRWWKASLGHEHENEHERKQQQHQEKEYSIDDEAGPESHAVMRGISMVSRKRIALNKPVTDEVEEEVSAPSEVESAPLSSTSLESHFFQLPNLLKSSKGGYLCTGLDLYITHEPCICCSMGMLLSRFRSITVLNSGMRRSAESNALDAVNGYGLHWREELNWRAIGFEFFESGGGEGKAEREEFNA